MRNLAGAYKPSTDIAIRDELHEAGIAVIHHDHFIPHTEVLTYLSGTFMGWVFVRSWYYWACRSPEGGLTPEIAAQLHKTHGKEVRAAGDCACGPPEEWFGKKLANLYHVDTGDGLAALVKAIREGSP